MVSLHGTCSCELPALYSLETLSQQRVPHHHFERGLDSCMLSQTSSMASMSCG